MVLTADRHVKCIYKDSDRNIQLRDGSLALTIRRDSDSYRQGNDTQWYTSAKVVASTPRNGIAFVEIRAALPRGKMLSPEIKIYRFQSFTAYLISKNDGKRRFQDDRTVYTYPPKRNSSLDMKYKTYPDTDALISKSDLTNFHTYALELNRHEIHWLFDGRKQMSLTGVYTHDFQSDPVHISMALNIGGNEYANQSLDDSDHMGWQCSAFIVDYIRVYKWSDMDIAPNTTDLNPVQSATICHDIMQEIKDEQLPRG
ncbi:unnamed protein product, partial [Oppiella nova]